ncbi:arginyl-tRNA synthetase [Nematocida homosporus]|uniref:arginyl-tRNA synthetase n=1 Tax=Nematocida homosporus TaxID=1912981 RepID=UPI002220070E|nr:arginyl-tRNA synthetase [Nematocida homosporus]KAI5187603.1 arginyl-tRNA synthetase [Nematocida homosporus]
MDKVRKEIENAIVDATGFDREAVSRSIMRSRNLKNGDFMIPFSQLTRDTEVITKVESYFTSQTFKSIAKVEVNGQMIFVFADTKEVAKDILGDILESQKDSYGSSQEGSGKCVVIDFSSPNIAKVFHAGHLRTTIIGNYIQNIYKKMGYKTVSINYLGDWGKQFGLLGVGYKRHGDEEKMRLDPIKHLHDVYVQTNKDAAEDPTVHDKAREFFKRMEEGDPAALSLWQSFRELSIAKYKTLYAKMNVHFDVYGGESSYRLNVLAGIRNRSYVEQCEDGSCIADLGNLGKFVLFKNDGTALYITRDIAAAEDRIATYQPARLIYVVASQQDLHFKQLFKLLAKDGYPPELFLHINYGMVRGMSTRRGQVVFLEDIIDCAQEAVKEVMASSTKLDQIKDKESTSLTLAMSAIIIQDLKAKRAKDYEFDMKKNTSFVGDTGPYVQYTVCRLKSIERNASLVLPPVSQMDFKYLEDPRSYDLVFLLGRYPSVVQESFKGHEPSVLVTYIFQVCKMVNAIFKAVWVANQPKESAEPRLAMYMAARLVLCDAMKLLGIVPLEMM